MRNRVWGLLVCMGVCLAASQSFGAFWWNTVNGSPPSNQMLTLNVSVYQMVVGGSNGEIPDSTGDEVRGIFKVMSISDGLNQYWTDAAAQGFNQELTGAFWGFVAQTNAGTVWDFSGGKFEIYDDNKRDFNPDFNITTAADAQEAATTAWTTVARGQGFANGNLMLAFDATQGSDGPTGTMRAMANPGIPGFPASMLSNTYLDATGGWFQLQWQVDGADLGGLILNQDFLANSFSVSSNPLQGANWPTYGNGGLSALYTPEPSTAVGLFTLGLALAGLVWRRRGKR